MRDRGDVGGVGIDRSSRFSCRASLVSRSEGSTCGLSRVGTVELLLAIIASEPSPFAALSSPRKDSPLSILDENGPSLE